MEDRRWMNAVKQSVVAWPQEESQDGLKGRTGVGVHKVVLPSGRQHHLVMIAPARLSDHLLTVSRV